jgi:hypothetical protein
MVGHNGVEQLFDVPIKSVVWLGWGGTALLATLTRQIGKLVLSATVAVVSLSYSTVAITALAGIKWAWGNGVFRSVTRLAIWLLVGHGWGGYFLSFSHFLHLTEPVLSFLVTDDMKCATYFPHNEISWWSS